jgi:hypothetical protein
MSTSDNWEGEQYLREQYIKPYLDKHEKILKEWKQFIESCNVVNPSVEYSIYTPDCTIYTSRGFRYKTLKEAQEACKYGPFQWNDYKAKGFFIARCESLTNKWPVQTITIDVDSEQGKAHKLTFGENVYFMIQYPKDSINSKSKECKFPTIHAAKDSIVMPGFEWKDFKSKGYSIMQVIVPSNLKVERIVEEEPTFSLVSL